MKTYLFAWNPKRWKWADLPQAVAEAKEEGGYLSQLTCKSYKSVKEGDRAFLILLGVPPKGIIGAGLVFSQPFRKRHYNSERAEQGDEVYSVSILFDLLDEKPIITEEELRSNDLGNYKNWFPEGSGIAIPEHFANLLENRLTEITGDRFIPPTKHEIKLLQGRTEPATPPPSDMERIGEIEGISVGQIFENRQELHDACIHRNPRAGISYRGYSVVLSGGYEDEDHGDEIIYTGHGGRDNNTGLQIANQTLTYGNLKLFNNFREGIPIRVSRGSGANSKYAPGHGYQYDGLYRIENAWYATGREGYKIWRYKLIKLSNNEIITTTPTLNPPQGAKNTQRTQVTTSRVIRSSVIGNYVKGMYDYTCQISGERLNTPNGPYAEACHIQPVGRPHNGPDEVSNVLCLSPNMHVLFDLGAISINDDLTLVGIEGRLTINDEHDLSKDAIRYHRDHILRE